ncbi:hypothetical protein V6N11_075012 [Hibiscus sabdariffa]|uniref:Endonuclease/exonuclease/phosphatase domain-containing protein n=1 Tax=Hibiscus sabdariffa TaxID=183260 RepID=A0ABR2R5C8_9ROSI
MKLILLGLLSICPSCQADGHRSSYGLAVERGSATKDEGPPEDYPKSESPVEIRFVWICLLRNNSQLALLELPLFVDRVRLGCTLKHGHDFSWNHIGMRCDEPGEEESWNVRGLGNQNTVRALRDSIDKHHPSVVFLSETKQKKRYLEKIRRRNRYNGCFYIDPIGIAGGLALWWNDDINLVVTKSCKNFIDTTISVKIGEEWFCTSIYGPPYIEEKEIFWENLLKIRSHLNCKWCVIGDTNLIWNQDEKSGGIAVNPNHSRLLSKFINRSFLMEMPLKGGYFTCSNQRCDEAAILEKLDRILISGEWSFLFPKAVGLIEAATASDHNPIILLLGGHRKRRKKDFKFESKWLIEEECSSNVNEAWSNSNFDSTGSLFDRKIKATRFKLGKWSREKFGRHRVTCEDLKKRILQLQNSPLSVSSKEEL